MTVADEIRRLQMRHSNEQKQRLVREARRQKESFEAKRGNAPMVGIGINADFQRTLERKAAEAKERAGKQQRVDLPDVIDKLRVEGKLPPAPDDATKVRYEPTPEEILGDDAIEASKAPPIPALADPVPDAETVLSLEGKPILPGALTAEEIAEIDALNPPRQKSLGNGQPQHKTKNQQRPRGR